MQYFAAILIKSDLSREGLDKYYANYRKDEWSYQVEIQTDKYIDALDGRWSFSVPDDTVFSNYYIVYSIGKDIGFFSALDIRGH